MSFETRLVDPPLIDAFAPPAPPLDDAGELLLDDTLKALAEQMQREAQDLAIHFPAAQPDSRDAAAVGEITRSLALAEAKPAAARRCATELRWLGVAVIGLASVAGAFLLLGFVPEGNREPSPGLEQVVSSSPGVPGRAPSLADDVPATEPATREPVSPIPLRVVPVGLTPTFSGPEWEGVLDLMEAQQADEPDVAI